MPSTDPGRTCHGQLHDRRRQHRLRADRGGSAVRRDAGRSVQQGRPRNPRAGSRSGRARLPGVDLGPTQHRRFRRLLPGGVGVGDAGRRAGRSAPPARSGPGGDRRRLGRGPGLAAGRCPPSRCCLEAGIAMDFGRCLRTHASGRPLLRGVDTGGVEWGYGGGRFPAGMERSHRAQSGRTGNGSSTSIPGSSSEPSNGG